MLLQMVVATGLSTYQTNKVHPSLVSRTDHPFFINGNLWPLNSPDIHPLHLVVIQLLEGVLSRARMYVWAPPQIGHSLNPGKFKQGIYPKDACHP